MAQFDSGGGGTTSDGTDDTEERDRRDDDGGGRQTGPGPGGDGGPRTSSGDPSAGGDPGTQEDPGTETEGPGPDGDGGPRTSSGDPLEPDVRSGDEVPPWRRPDPTGGEPEPESDTRRVDPGDRPRVSREFERRIEEATGRDVEAGEQFSIRRRGNRFFANISGPFFASLSREAVREAGLVLGEQAKRAQERAELAGDGPALESDGLVVGLDFFEGDGEGQRIDVKAVEDLGEQREAEREAAAARLSGAASAASAAGVTPGDRAAQATEPLTEAVSTLERRATETLTGAAEAVGLDADVSVDVPGEGPLLTRLEEPSDPPGFQSLSERAAAGEFIPAGDVADAIQTDVLDPAEQRFIDLTEIQGPAIEAAPTRPGRAGAAARTERDAFTGAGRQPAAQVSQGVLRSPLLVTSGTSFLIDAAQGGATAGRAAAARDTERLEELATGAGQAAIAAGVLTASSAARDPGAFAARTTGQLIGSVGLFGAARAIGPRASLATRSVIQPGEEALGIGGFAVTRRIAGRGAAQRLFPNREPLIFSEEAALRQARRATARARDVAARGRGLLSRIEIEPRVAAGPVPPRVRVRERQRSAEESTVRPGGLMGDPETFPVRELREQSRMRQEQDQRTAETAEELARLLESQEPEVGRFETELERRQGLEFEGLAIESERLLESALLAQGLDDFLAQDIKVGTELLQDLQLDVEQEPDVDVEPRTDIETEQDIETETEFEIELETEFEAEQEAEREIEAETEVEFETEFETEVEPQQRQRRRRTRRDVELDTFERTFTSPVAAPSAVLSGLGGAGGGFDDDDLLTPLGATDIDLGAGTADDGGGDADELGADLLGPDPTLAEDF